jgi:hypothetical protein
MTKSLTRQSSSQAVLELIEDKVASLSEAGYYYEMKLRELDHQFESRAAELREEYLAAVLEIHEAPDRERRTMHWHRGREVSASRRNLEEHGFGIGRIARGNGNQERANSYRGGASGRDS